MDLVAEIDRAVNEMAWSELVFTLQDAIYEILRNTSICAPVGLEHNVYPQPTESQDGGYKAWSSHGAAPPASGPQNPVTAVPNNPKMHCRPLQKQAMRPDHLHTQPGTRLEVHTRPQPEQRGCGRCIPSGAASHVFEQQNPATAALSPSMHCAPRQEGVVQPGPMCTQTGPSSQGQYNNAPPLRLLEGYACVGVLNGWILCKVPAGLAPPLSASPLPYASSSNNGQVLRPPPVPPAFANPPPKPCKPKKRKSDRQPDNDHPYIKKPLNAFMLFMKEQRPNVDANISSKGSAAVNTLLGERWKALSKEGQAKYHENAERERRLHAERHPEWSSSNNYGKKRKRERRKAAVNTKESASSKLFFRSPQTQVLVIQRVMPSCSQTDGMGALCRQRTEAPVTVSECPTCHLPKVRHHPGLDAPTAASTSQHFWTLDITQLSV